jgi:hypothetical protein
VTAHADQMVIDALHVFPTRDFPRDFPRDEKSPSFESVKPASYSNKRTLCSRAFKLLRNYRKRHVELIGITKILDIPYLEKKMCEGINSLPKSHVRLLTNLKITSN